MAEQVLRMHEVWVQAPVRPLKEKKRLLRFSTVEMWAARRRNPSRSHRAPTETERRG